ncbi:shikimate kinase [Halobacillus halophilus]|uniref:shikimate kinase n=1 Tax=Halobacillus halophilus TaxID=1570 RepID=UPI001CD6C48C|nr:shikimate kinase [Halobacillus halophilus]MCA1009664.1 shikimate kinase [Halobacillus halophilus]
MIYLVGFMGSGKSTIAGKLSEKLNLPYIEMDKAIEEKEQMTISDIFAQFGEAHFRECETHLLKNIGEESVVSTGGGVVLKEENQHYLSTGTVVFLRASWNTIVSRLQNDEDRPLWKGDLTEKHALFALRQPTYESLADLIIEVDNKNPEEIVNEIMDRLKK